MQCCWLRRLNIWNRLLIREVVVVPVYDAGKNRQDLLFFFFFFDSKFISDPLHTSQHLQRFMLLTSCSYHVKVNPQYFI